LRASPDEQRRAGVLPYSSGNHAQAIALSASLVGIHSAIIMPHDAPALKVQATKGYGGEVIVYDRYKEEREEIGQRLARERGMTLIPLYDHPDVIAGQGTAAKELFERLANLTCCWCAWAVAACWPAARSPPQP
jgi:threonine dehydratase